MHDQYRLTYAFYPPLKCKHCYVDKHAARHENSRRLTLYPNDKTGDIETPSLQPGALSMQTLLPTGVFWMIGCGLGSGPTGKKTQLVPSMGILGDKGAPRVGSTRGRLNPNCHDQSGQRIKPGTARRNAPHLNPTCVAPHFISSASAWAACPCSHPAKPSRPLPHSPPTWRENGFGHGVQQRVNTKVQAGGWHARRRALCGGTS